MAISLGQELSIIVFSTERSEGLPSPEPAYEPAAGIGTLQMR